MQFPFGFYDKEKKFVAFEDIGRGDLCIAVGNGLYKCDNQSDNLADEKVLDSLYKEV